MNEIVKEPTDEIKGIFNKIETWKKSLGDLAEQEKKVSQKLKPSNPIKIHNAKTAFELLNLLKSEIKLTDEEIHIIIFSSLDFDWFTNLLVSQGEFRKWFDLDYAGVGTEETDFMDNKLDIWKAVTTQASKVVAKFKQTKDNTEDILT